jgi:hypothetical protein
MALNWLRLNKSKICGVKTKRMLCAVDTNFLLKISNSWLYDCPAFHLSISQSWMLQLIQWKNKTRSENYISLQRPSATLKTSHSGHWIS